MIHPSSPISRRYLFNKRYRIRISLYHVTNRSFVSTIGNSSSKKKKRIKKSYSFISKNKSLVIVINCGNNLILIKHFFRINFSSKTLTHMCSILFQLKLFQVKRKKKLRKQFDNHCFENIL